VRFSLGGCLLQGRCEPAGAPLAGVHQPGGLRPVGGVLAGQRRDYRLGSGPREFPRRERQQAHPHAGSLVFDAPLIAFAFAMPVATVAPWWRRCR
jgi:hypothetical protein